MEQVISFNFHRHAVMECIPLQAEMHADAPAYFKVI